MYTKTGYPLNILNSTVPKNKNRVHYCYRNIDKRGKIIIKRENLFVITKWGD